MESPRKPLLLSMVLGILSAAAIVVSHLALTDIYKGETDLTAEWTALRVAFLVIIAFHAVALTTIGGALRS